MTRLKVAVRVRPLSEREIDAGAVSVVTVENGDTLAVTNIKVSEQYAGDSRERVRRFTFDRCYDENDSQDTIFKAIEEVIGQSMKQRFHSCILAYGQSCSGKTHTMMGFPQDPGLTPKLCDKVFEYLQESAVGDEINAMRVSVSYLEIYNEKVKDLLSVQEPNLKNPNRSHSLKVREHPKKGPYVQGLSEHPVYNSSDLLDWLETGNKRRRVAATFSNPKSSRSHSVFSVNCDGVKLNLIDLAGSERAGSRCVNLSTFKEGANINKSLVALGNVISALAEQTSSSRSGPRRRFVPYRDSVLTWLLKDTLGGNSNTFMVATVSPSNSCYSETVNTLRFGQRAKLIVSRPVINEDPKERTIRELRAEIFRLRELLKGLQCPQVLPLNPMTETWEKRPQEISKPDEVWKPRGIDNVTTEKLLPLINVESDALKVKVKPTTLKRTFSLDHKMEKPNLFGSNDSIPSASTKSMASTPTSEKGSTSSEKSKTAVSSLRRRSLTKPLPSLPKSKRGSLEGDKLEKSGSTENLKKVTSKVDSIRRPQPRSHIVAAVTSRLYSKVKRKEVATDTLDMDSYITEDPKSNTICSNARKRLQELTKRALKSHKNKNEETQTDHLPARIVKEISTDITDLPMVMAEVKEVATMSDQVQTKDVSVDCTPLERFNEDSSSNTIGLTRSCGTQFEDVERKPPHQPISFTKYLKDLQQDISPNPIYTQAVNINISNNYLNGTRVSCSTSTDSLEQNLGLPTPDLISNHNSLEPQQSKEFKVLHESVEELQEQIFNSANLIQEPQVVIHVTAETTMVPDSTNSSPTTNIEKSFASEIYHGISNEEFCRPLPRFVPQTRRAQAVPKSRVESERYHVMEDPLVLKSIVKENPSEDETQFKSEPPDSLEYHKRVKFSEKISQEKRVFKAMSGFLEEATQLMSRIDRYAGSLFDNNLEIEVTVHDSRKPRKPIRKSRRVLERPRSAVFPSHLDRKDNFNQTYEPPKSDSYTQYEENFCLPLNRYEALLEETCRRLEEKIQPLTQHRRVHDDYGDDFNITDPEDSSMDSNAVAFSDYGSLPRRTHKRYRRPACSPSAFLKQLTNMRKQIIKTSREDLLAGGCNH